MILVSGRRESLISRTTSVLVRSAGSIRVNFIICPGNHDGGAGRVGIDMCISAMMNGAWLIEVVLGIHVQGKSGTRYPQPWPRKVTRRLLRRVAWLCPMEYSLFRNREQRGHVLTRIEQRKMSPMLYLGLLY